MEFALVLIYVLVLGAVFNLGYSIYELSNDTKRLYKYWEEHLDKIEALERYINLLERKMKDLDEAYERLCSSYTRLESRVYGPMEKPKSPKNFKTGLVVNPIARKQPEQQVIRKNLIASR